MSAVGNVMRQASRGNSKLRVCEWVIHERYQENLAKTGHDFFIIQVDHPNFKKHWNTNYAKLPNNFTLLPLIKGDTPQELINGIMQEISKLDLDLMMSHHKFGVFQVAKNLADLCHIPLISLEHTFPMPYWHPSQIQQCRQMVGNVNLFISDFSKNAWGWKNDEAYTIYHGVDTDTFCPDENIVRKPVVLSICNDFVVRDIPCGYSLFKKVTEGFSTRLRGDTPGISTPTTSTEELVNEYRSCQIFLNTSQYSPIPSVCLEAASCGCAIITTDNCALPEVFKHEENALMTNDPKKIREYIRLLLNDEQLRNKLGTAARKTIIEKFSLDKFVNNWNEILTKTAQIPFL